MRDALSRADQDREAKHAAEGRPARIIAKMNALVDAESSGAVRGVAGGVEIDLIVRGICCLRPGVPGVSDRIRVISIVGRFLEHSRVFYFANAAMEEYYFGSADWMPRNFDRRVEAVTPVRGQVAASASRVAARHLLSRTTVRRGSFEPDGTDTCSGTRTAAPERSAHAIFLRPAGVRVRALVEGSGARTRRHRDSATHSIFDSSRRSPMVVSPASDIRLSSVGPTAVTVYSDRFSAWRNDLDGNAGDLGEQICFFVGAPELEADRCALGVAPAVMRSAGRASAPSSPRLRPCARDRSRRRREESPRGA